MREFFRDFSFPGGIGSHCTPETPGSIHEGGELGYSLSHAFGAAFDNPELLVTVVVGDGEAETGPLATAWHSNKFLNPVRDGAVLPILQPERLQDQQPHRARTDQPRGARGPVPRLRLDAALRRGRRPCHDARGDGLGHGSLRARDPPHPAVRARERPGRATALADDRAAQPQGLDRAEARRRAPHRGYLARASGAAGRRAREPGAAAAARGVDALLPARRTVRRRRAPARGTARARAARRATNERQPARQRRPAAPCAAPAGLPRLRGGRAGAGPLQRRRHARARLPAARHPARQPAQFPRLRPGRDQLEQARRGVRGERQDLARRAAAGGRRRRRAGARRPRDGVPAASTRSRAGWKATCSPGATASCRPTRPSRT